ncbi:MAG: hypothetical protein IJG53_03465 [Eggerthellaceae bacterium]|nr:hypothetical protein [Eggerthellaceae bacterium]
MNPLVIIPTYVSARSKGSTSTVTATYDHTTMLSEMGQLPRLLNSLRGVEGLGTIAVLVASEPNISSQAAEKVQVIIDRFPDLDILLVGSAEQTILQQRMEQLSIGRMAKEMGLSGYGAVKNFGILVAAALGFDSVIFLDDDEEVEDPAFLRNAVYGLGKLTRMGIPILAKTGYFLDEYDSPFSSAGGKWYNRSWDIGRAFNKWMEGALAGPRLSRSNYVCGGCMAIHREAFRRVAFDPWISRGEDLDYMLNLRMYGSDIWFDNKWFLRHMPPEGTITPAQRFRQDVYRWLYEYRKLEFSRAQIDLLQVKPDTLQPYPGPFLEPGLEKRLARAARLRGLFSSEGKVWRAAAKAANAEAASYAEKNCGRYFELQRIWPEIVNRISNDVIVANAFKQANETRRGIESSFAQRVYDRIFGQIAAANAEAAAAGEGAMDAAAAAATAAAAAPAARGYQTLDPGTTGEIRMNLAE